MNLLPFPGHQEIKQVICSSTILHHKEEQPSSNNIFQKEATVKVSKKKLVRGLVIGLFTMIYTTGAWAAETPRMDRVARDATKIPSRIVVMADVGVAMVDTINCLCNEDLGRMNVMAPSTVRVKVYNLGKVNAPIKLQLDFKRVNKTNENLVRFLTLAPNEYKWVTFWTSPMLFDKLKGLKATVTLMADRTIMTDPVTTNNSYLNNTCFPYVE
jgi:hypothetical protein